MPSFKTKQKKKSKFTAFTYTSTPVLDKQKLTDEDISITNKQRLITITTHNTENTLMILCETFLITVLLT